ncbi:MAG: peptidase MA family metallohydrolase [Chloroflexota bacterium]
MKYQESRLLALALCLAAILTVASALVLPGMVSRASTSGITLETSVQVSFPNSMLFMVKAESDADIMELRLHYTVERQNYALVTSEAWAQFRPALVVDTSWLWDMRKGGLPPGAVLQYWWTAEDAAGRSSASSPTNVSFEDDRYKWQAVTEGAVTLLWYEGGRPFADELLASAQQALQRLSADTGASPPGKVGIYVYASAADLRGALLFPQEWTGGVAFVSYNIIAIGIPTSALSWGKRAVAHELTHWVVGGLTFNSYGAGLPTWLEEGLATYGEGDMSPDTKAWLDKAISENKLLSVRSLSSPFSAITEQAYISYAQSYSLVAYLIREHGRERMLELLNVFRQGSGYDQALRQVYGFDQDGLDTLWRRSIGVQTSLSRQLEPALV